MSVVIGSGDAVSIPSAPVAVLAAAGGLSNGAYTYRVTYVTVFGESLPSVASNTITAAAGNGAAVAIPLSADNFVAARRLYRTAAGGANYLLVTTINDNITTMYNDTVSDASLGVAAPVFSTADTYQQINGYVRFVRPLVKNVAVGVIAQPGGGQNGATQIVSDITVVGTVATAGDSVRLPPANANYIGMDITVKNLGAASLSVFPVAGQTINNLAANTSISIAAGANAKFIAISATNWMQM